MLDNDLAPLASERFDQVERPWKRLLVGAEAKKDQRRFQMSARG